ncbi:DsbA family oxidoreductase [Primorskyibacter sp. 2E107]|uniref:DsbA family oxidoreductase n=1 Tax=Primorskyibacter sp. 2E107 TaxID=3403458 RepID=UPI003AF483D3
MAALTLDFFHDAVCAWCFNLSPRLRTLAREHDLDIRHHTFVLQASPAEMAARWGSAAKARETILAHWSQCRAASDRPTFINIDGMRRAAFDYPHGMLAALACKAAETVGGQAGHWDMFDRLQHAHITKARNIADRAVILALAASLGYDQTAFNTLLDDTRIARAVDADRQRARQLNIRSVPTLRVRETGVQLLHGSMEDLRAQIMHAARLADAHKGAA